MRKVYFSILEVIELRVKVDFRGVYGCRLIVAVSLNYPVNETYFSFMLKIITRNVRIASFYVR